MLIKNFKITNKTPSKSNIKTIKATVEYLLKYIKKCYEDTGAVTPAQITAHFDSGEDNTHVARILSLDNMSDDSLKAYEDYVRIIKTEMKKRSIQRLVNSTQEEDLSAINDLLKNE